MGRGSYKGFGIGINAAARGPDGEWRFTFAVIEDGGIKRVIFGTEPGEDGMKEPKFRAVLAGQCGMSAAEVNEAVIGAIEGAAGACA